MRVIGYPLEYLFDASEQGIGTVYHSRVTGYVRETTSGFSAFVDVSLSKSPRKYFLPTSSYDYLEGLTSYHTVTGRRSGVLSVT